MKAFCGVLALLACAPLASGFTFNPKKTSLLAFDSVNAKNRPVSKVITLLKDMQTQLEKESEEDQEIYDKMACWCQTNQVKKTASIKEGKAKLARLNTRIDSLTASSARLGTEKKNAQKELSADEKALDKATGLRVKEQREFTAEEKDSLQSIAALKSAVVVLSKQNSMLQVDQSHMMAMADSIKRVLSKNTDKLTESLTPRHKRIMSTFIQSPESYFRAKPASFRQFSQYEAPQSGEVFGILKQMKESFESGLASAQKEEMTNQQAYNDLKSAKVSQIKAGEAVIEKRTQELADTGSKLQEDKQDNVDTTEILGTDEGFLANVEEKCALMDREHEARTKGRMIEMEAVAKALELLSGDDAHDLFTKTFNPSLLQTNSGDMAVRRQKAASLLKSLAVKHDRPRLATLAMRVQLDAFTKVKKAISDMVSQLINEKEDEIKHKDFCVEEFNKNELQTEKKTATKKDTEAMLEDLEMTIKKLADEIKERKADVADLEVQLKRAGEDREKQNKEFQEVVADQRATQALLKQALTVLSDVYEKAAVFAQTKDLVVQSQGQPAGFKTYKKSGGGGGVVGMIQQIIADAKAMEAEAIRDEEDAQKTYENFVKDTNASLERKGKEIVHKTKKKAEKEAALVEAKKDLESVLLELEQLNNAKSELHAGCDFIMKNFEIRQTARDEEVEALKQASAILSGSKFSGFLQQLVRP